MDCINCHGGMLAVGGEYNLLAGAASMELTMAEVAAPGKTFRAVSLVTRRCSQSPQRSRTRSGRLGHSPDAGLPHRRQFGVTLARHQQALCRAGQHSLPLQQRHGGVRCENCHGSTHAEWPIANDAANDNVAAKTLQGYAGKIIECRVCHIQGSLPLTINGPHGLHNVNDSRWLSESHGQFYTNNKSGCKACHGLDLLGTPLAKMPIARTFTVEGNTISYAREL